jgi:hypothetical protein
VRAIQPTSTHARSPGKQACDGLSISPAPDLVTTQTTTTPNKTSIKARIRALISTATSGLPKPEAAHLAFSLSSTAIPGARLIKRRHWSIT